MTTTHTRYFPNRSAAARKGFGVFMILGIILMVGIVAIVLLTGWLSYHRQQLQTGGDAAALAAAARLMDPWVLDPAATGPSVDPARIEAAKQTALDYLMANRAYGSDESLDAGFVLNAANTPGGGTLVGHIDYKPGLNAPFVPWNPEAAQTDAANASPTASPDEDDIVNAIAIRNVRSEKQSNAVSSWFAQMFLKPYGETQAESVAILQQNIDGFRPVRLVGENFSNIPMAPIAVKLPNDNPLLDWRSPEIDIELESVEDTPQSRLTGSRIVFPGENTNDDTLFFTRLKSGIAPADLAQMNGEIRLADVLTTEPLDIAAQSDQWSALDDSLYAQVRIWPIVLPAEDSSDDASTDTPTDVATDFGTATDAATTNTGSSGQSQIIGFVAGRIVGLESTGSTIVVKVRPELLQTSTGIITPTAKPNPWIGKVHLVW